MTDPSVGSTTRIRSSRQLLPPCHHTVQEHYEELIKTERIRQRRKAWEGYMATANDPLEAEQESDASRE